MEMTFANLLKRLERKKPDLGEHVDALQTLIGAAACLVGDGATGGFPALITALSEKEKLIDLGKLLLKKIAGETPDDFSGIENQMRDAYGALCFTAFFDELNDRLPKDIRTQIRLSPGEAQSLTRQPVLLAHELTLPDSFHGSAKAEQDLQKLYDAMTRRLADFIGQTSFAETADEQEQRTLQAVLDELPAGAVRRFHDQFLTLCDKIPRFRIYVSTRQAAALWDALQQMPTRIKTEKVRKITDALIDHYRRGVQRPLIRDDDETESLHYPALDKAFIPQRYQRLRYEGKEQRLELPQTWDRKKVEVRTDMMDFWKGYLADPDSVYRPLLILGEPGSGKSCLTEIVCGRMSTKNSVMVRIPLRDYDLEDEIESIICRQMIADGDADEPFHKLKWFAEEFPLSPLTLFFDGYDEVMQATGGVYRNLLNKIKRFQDGCRENGRPVRVVITSRDTLIDKADIPKGTDVIKLLEFDEDQKQEWIDIWNECNRDIWSADGIHEFSLFDNDSLNAILDNRNLTALSGQPLLLLMLAIYDADFEHNANALWRGQEDDLDRTELYDELLRRFIRRELRKGKRGQEDYQNADDDKRQRMEDTEMQKLGVAALGMFVREKLSMKESELEHDFQIMNIRFPEKHVAFFFGSFFFVHKAEGPKDGKKHDAEYEFLHKTFYEFLLADVTLYYYIDALECLRKNRDLKGPYYAALNGACLCTEPETAQMIGEWTNRKRVRYFEGDMSDFEAVSADLFTRHFHTIRDGEFQPAWQKGGLTGKRTFPQLCAVYLMNLLSVRVLTCGRCDIPVDEWKYLALYLKLNLPAMKETKHEWNIEPSEEIILNFIELFHLYAPLMQDFASLELIDYADDPFSFDLFSSFLDVKYELAHFLQDNVTANLYSIYYYPDDNQSAYSKLIQQGMPMEVEYNLARLHDAVLYPRRVSDNELYHLLLNATPRILSSSSFFVWDFLQCLYTLVLRRPALKQLDNSAVIRHFLSSLPIGKYPQEIQFLAQEIENQLDAP